MALTAWTLFAFAGAYLWTVLPLVAGAILTTLVLRPSLARGSFRALDIALLACLLVIALQLVPLTPSWRQALSPHLAEILDQLWLAPGAAAGSPGPLTIDSRSTGLALLLAATFALVFWSARDALHRGGLRLMARGLSWIGLALAAVALLQRATAPRHLYWIYPTIFGAPFGPYLNRNDFATWLIMAIPLTIGYGLTRIDSKSPRAHGASMAVELSDRTSVALAASACLLSAALFSSLSRSGLVGGLAALACFLGLGRTRLRGGTRTSLVIGMAIVVAVAATYANLGALADRVGETLTSGVGGRRAIWRDTWRLVTDFAATGIGAGTYERAMLAYQQTKGLFYFNHAHNEYLQLAAEGGLMLCVPAAAALAAGSWRVAKRLRADRTPIFWIRAGAASGLAAVMVQSLWDTGLRMPANAVMFALLAALAVHEPGHTKTSDSGQRPKGNGSGER